MKTSRRMISALLAAIFVITSLVTVPVFAADFTDLTSEHDAFEAVNVLGKLGVINGYEDGSFKPENNVTRAEFTAMLLRTRGMGSIGSTSIENPPFPDVTTSDVSWAIGNIRTAQGMGVINGYEDGTFRPKNNVSYEEAIKMMVCALGYENFGVAGNEWYSKFVMTANTLGFLENSGGTIGTPATRATIAKMLYNCLEINLAENNEETDKTILENDLKLKKKTGIIASNNVTSLSKPDTQLRENEIEIDAPTDDGKSSSVLVYQVDDAAAYRDMFGAQITFYYSEDRVAQTRTVILTTVERSKTLTIDAKDLVTNQCSASSIAYYADEDAKDITQVAIAPNAYVIYNDKLYGSDGTNSVYSQYYSYVTTTPGMSLPNVGSIKLLDKDGDKTYDVVFVDDYKTYIVSSVTTSTYTVVDSILNQTVKLDPTESNHEIKFVDGSGNASSFGAIRAGSVISVKESNPANGGVNYVTVEIKSSSDAVISGSVKSMVAGKSVTINGKDYEFSLQAPWMAPGGSVTMPTPVMDDNGKFYLDKNGDIIAYDKTEVKENQYYGYLTEAPSRTGGIGGDELYFDIIMFNSGKAKMTRYTAYEKTKVNGTEYSSYTDIVNALKAVVAADTDRYATGVTNDEVSQLVKFTTITYKNKEVVDNIITATDSAAGAAVTGTALTSYTGITAQNVSKYSTTERKMYKDALASGSFVNIGSGTLLLRVPDNRTSDDEYKKLSTGDLNSTDSYYIEYYDVSATTTASVALVYGGVNTNTGVSVNSPFVVVTNIPGKETNADEETAMWKFEGYDTRNNREVAGWISTASESVFEKVKVGDVVRLGTDVDGYYTIEDKHILFGADVIRDNVYNYAGDATVGANGEYHQLDAGIGEGGSNVAPRYRVIWGSVHAKDDNAVNISTKVITASQSDPGYIHSIGRSSFGSARAYMYSKKNGTLEMVQLGTEGNPTIAQAIDGFTVYDSANPTVEPTEIFVYLVSNAVKLMIIVN